MHDFLLFYFLFFRFSNSYIMKLNIIEYEIMILHLEKLNCLMAHSFICLTIFLNKVKDMLIKARLL